MRMRIWEGVRVFSRSISLTANDFAVKNWKKSGNVGLLLVAHLMKAIVVHKKDPALGLVDRS